MKIIPHTSDCQTCTFKSLLFTKMKDDELQFINKDRKEFLFDKGEMIIEEGSPVKEFLYLKRGLVKLVKKGEKVRAFVHYNSFNQWGWLDTLPPEILKDIEVFAGDILFLQSMQKRSVPILLA